jgi:hypothetical protein
MSGAYSAGTARPAQRVGLASRDACWHRGEHDSQSRAEKAGGKKDGLEMHLDDCLLFVGEESVKAEEQAGMELQDGGQQRASKSGEGVAASTAIYIAAQLSIEGASYRQLK